jgi:hypothetical protein
MRSRARLDQQEATSQLRHYERPPDQCEFAENFGTVVPDSERLEAPGNITMKTARGSLILPASNDYEKSRDNRRWHIGSQV